MNRMAQLAPRLARAWGPVNVITDPLRRDQPGGEQGGRVLPVS
jgi:hypothetical protein